MNSSWCFRSFKLYKEIIFTGAALCFFVITLPVIIAHYQKTGIIPTLATTAKRVAQKISVSNETVELKTNSSTSCSTQFRTQLPMFSWPPKPICDMKCAVDGLRTALLTVPWFAEKYRHFLNITTLGTDKWFKIEHYLPEMASRLNGFGLHPPTKQQNFLDIGTGFGYVPFFASHFGHCVMAVDIYINTPGSYTEFFPNVTRILGVDVRQHAVRPKTPFPVNLFDGVKFDVVTAVLTQFHCYPRIWLLSDWIFFFSDIARHHTTDNALVVIYLNTCNDKGGQVVYPVDNNLTVNVLGNMGVEFVKSYGWRRGMVIKNLDAFRQL